MAERNVAPFLKYDPRVLHANRPVWKFQFLFFSQTLIRLPAQSAACHTHRTHLPEINIFESQISVAVWILRH
jgi:hypothetical protein